MSGGGIGQRHVDEQRRPPGLGQPLRPGRGEDRPVRDRQPAADAGAVLEDVEDAVPGRVAPGQEGRPGRPRVRGQARAGDALLAGGDQPREVRQLAPLQHRVEDVPVGSVPAHDQHASSHGPQDTGGRASARAGRSDAQICIDDVYSCTWPSSPHPPPRRPSASQARPATPGASSCGCSRGHPRLRGVACTADTRALAECDLAMLALPHGATSELGRELAGARVPVVDLAADHRGEWVYGLPELHRERIAGAAAGRQPRVLRHGRDARPGPARRAGAGRAAPGRRRQVGGVRRRQEGDGADALLLRRRGHRAVLAGRAPPPAGDRGAAAVARRRAAERDVHAAPGAVLAGPAGHRLRAADRAGDPGRAAGAVRRAVRRRALRPAGRRARGRRSSGEQTPATSASGPTRSARS